MIRTEFLPPPIVAQLMLAWLIAVIAVGVGVYIGKCLSPRKADFHALRHALLDALMKCQRCAGSGVLCIADGTVRCPSCGAGRELLKRTAR